MDLSFWGDYSPESVVQVPLHTAAQHASECHTFFNTSQLFRTVGHDPHLQPNLPSAFFAMLTILSAERMELCNMKSMNSDVSRHYIESNSLQKKQTVRNEARKNQENEREGHGIKVLYSASRLLNLVNYASTTFRVPEPETPPQPNCMCRRICRASTMSISAEISTSGQG